MRHPHRLLLLSLLLVLASSVVSPPASGLPDTSLVSCSTTKGTIKLEVHPAWAPRGAERFLELVSSDFFTDVALFRCIKGFICQFGIGATPEINAQWKQRGTIADDPHVTANGGFLKRGMVSFAGGGSDSRTTQLFVSLRDSKYLGKANWETPVAQVVEGMDVVDAWYKGYGDSSRHGGHAPEQSVLTHRGSEYIRGEYPDLDFIQSCSVVGTRAETGEMLTANVGAHSRQLP